MRIIFLAVLLLTSLASAVFAESAVNYRRIPGGQIVTMNSWDSKNPSVPLRSDARLVVNNHFVSIHNGDGPIKLFADDKPLGALMFDKVGSLDYAKVVSNSGLNYVVLVESEIGIPNNYWVLDVSGPIIELSPEIKGCVSYTMTLTSAGATFRCFHGQTVEMRQFVRGPAGIVGATEADRANGAADAAAREWFRSDRTLGCVYRDGKAVACGRENGATFRIFYGNAAGGPGLPDALVFVSFLSDPTGNAEELAIGQFRADPAGGYRFVRRLGPIPGSGPAPGSQVVFGQGQASWKMQVLAPGDSRGMPSGQRQVSVPVR